MYLATKHFLVGPELCSLYDLSLLWKSYLLYFLVPHLLLLPNLSNSPLFYTLFSACAPGSEFSFFLFLFSFFSLVSIPLALGAFLNPLYMSRPPHHVFLLIGPFSSSLVNHTASFNALVFPFCLLFQSCPFDTCTCRGTCFDFPFFFPSLAVESALLFFSRSN